MAADGSDVVHIPQPVRRIFAQPTQNSLDRLSVQIQDAVPACSLDCLNDFISSNYPHTLYRKYENIPCLCTEETRSGFTLGEAALRCLFSSCSTISQSDIGVYALCAGVGDALPNTHSTLTVAVTATPNITTTSGPPPTTTSSFSYSLLSSSDSTMVDSSPQATPSSLSTERANTTTPSAWRGRPTSEISLPTVVIGTALPSGTSIPTSSPTRNQVIGMSVAGAAVGVILLALATFFFVRRRRRPPFRRRHQNDGFEIGGVMAEPLKPDLPIPPLMSRAPRTPIGRYNQPVVQHLPAVPNARAYHGRSTPPKARGVTDAMEYVHSGHSMSATSSPATPNSASLLLANNAKCGRYDGTHSTNRADRRGRNSSVSILSEEMRGVQGQNRSWGPHVENRGMFLPRKGDSASQGDEQVHSAEAQPGSTSLATSRGNYSRKNPASEESLSPSPLLHHTTSSWPDNLLPMPSIISNDPVRSDSKKATRSIQQSRQGVQSTQPHPQLQRANSHDSSDSVTSIETLGSSEMNVSKIPQRVQTDLSPVKEYISPVLRHHDGCEQLHRLAPRPKVQELPYPVDHQSLSNYSRQTPVSETSQSRGHSRGDSLLAKRRGDSFADRMEKSISVPSGIHSASEISVPGSLTVADHGHPASVRSSKPRSSLPACEVFPQNRGVHPPRKMGEIEDLASPRELNMVPTRDGANLVLRFR